MVETILAERFRKLWLRCGDAGAQPGSVWGELLQNYTQPQRFYHNLGHLSQCLGELDAANPHIQELDATEMAVWFHDIIHDMESRDNESESALMFRDIAEPHMSADFVNRVCELILATTHRGAACDIGVAYLLDIDLSSFGLPWEGYLADSQALRKEAANISDEEFYAGKLRFLDRLLQRCEIFQTEYFRHRLEQKARANMERYIALIRSQGFGN